VKHAPLGISAGFHVLDSRCSCRFRWRSGRRDCGHLQGLPGNAGYRARHRRGLQQSQQLLDADRKTTPEGEVGKIDWDVFVDGQEWKLSELNVTLVSEAADHAQVSAKFNNFAEPKQILFDLVREDGRWLVDDVQSTTKGERWTMSKVLTGAADAFPDENTKPDPGAAAGSNTEIEYLCVKDHSKSYQGLVMACYSDTGCKYVQSIGGEPIRDCDRDSVPYALGREKIEGIVTSSAPIMKKIGEFGYECKKSGN
jgi:Protein of unknown function (DUF3828)